MNEQQFFYEILKETGRVFKDSPIKQSQEKLNKKWNYAICDTPIQKEKGLIVGLNWGGKKDYNSQKEYPPLIKEKRNWPFINNIKNPLKKYAGITSIDQINYSNLCFFRSPNIRYLNKKDWELSLPLFEKYVNYINPSWILLLGITGIKYLGDYLTITEKIKINGTKKQIRGFKGILFNKYDLMCIPHPNNHRFYSSKQVNDLWARMYSVSDVKNK